VARTLRGRAITLMKDGRTVDELRVLFVAEGASPDDVRAVLAELAELKRRAQAREPERLRGEAMRMFSHGATVDDVVAHFVRVGVQPEHARPEAERLCATFRSMRHCQRCGSLVPTTSIVYDSGGFAICLTCNLRDEISQSEMRAAAREADGVLGGPTVSSAFANTTAAPTMHPYCPACEDTTGAHVSDLAPAARARVDPRWEYVCARCLRGIR